MKKKSKIPGIILSVFLISFGIGVGYFFFQSFTFDFADIICMIFYIPTLCLGVVLPIVSGVLYLIELTKGPKNESEI